jgi:hypothetical protein
MPVEVGAVVRTTNTKVHSVCFPSATTAPAVTVENVTTAPQRLLSASAVEEFALKQSMLVAASKTRTIVMSHLEEDFSF